MSTRVVIVGGGISGLSTAFYLHRLAVEQGRVPPHIQLFEASDRLGGPVGTERVDGWLLERGPDSFLSTPPSVVQLVEELGLGDGLIVPNTCTPPLYLYRDGKLRALPPKMALVVPGDIDGFMHSDLLSPAGRERVRAEATLGPDAGMPGESGDVSIGEFFRARLGDEMVQVLVAPILAGIYSGDVDTLSLMSTFPRFVDMVRKHGSLLEGARLTVEAASSKPGPRNPFRSLRGGVGLLLETLLERIAGIESLDIHLERPVTAIERDGDTWSVAVGETSITADHVVVATPAWAAARLLGNVADTTSAGLAETPYTSTVGVYVGYPTAGLDLPGAAGVLLPRDKTFTIKGIQLGANKYPGRAPDGHALFRVFLGGVGRTEILEETDEALVDIVRRDLHTLFGVSGPPTIQRVLRYHRRSPQYVVGHGARMANALGAVPAGVHLVGAGYRGIGLPACIGEARRAAEEIV